ncbi:MAG: monofunctional biosynthetic peptidoglycan transglycosylase [Candidatus Binatia bacterium]
MRRVLFSTLVATLLVSAGYYFYISLPDVSRLKQKNPHITALMDLRDQEYKKQNSRGRRQQIWVSYGAISEHIKKAVLISEDAGFYSHKGVDVAELKAAFMKDLETLSFSRGGSTITMQLAKNLYLSPSKNPLRKLKEIIIAHQLENALSKRRIFEVYLNVVELGRNIYGVEAAARHYFGKSAGSVDLVEAATLAALLPSPRNSKKRGLAARRNIILNRLASVGYLSPSENRNAQQLAPAKKVEEAEIDPPPEQ